MCMAGELHGRDARHCRAASLPSVVGDLRFQQGHLLTKMQKKIPKAMIGKRLSAQQANMLLKLLS